MQGVVIADLVPILTGPGVEFEQVFTIPRGTSITVVGKSADDQWYMVRLPGYSDSQGSLWIPVNLVAIVSATETVTMTAAGFTPSPAPTETITTVLAMPSPIPAIQRSRSCGAHAGWIVYIVQPGDNLFRLSLKTNTTVNQIMAANCLASNQVVAGRPLYLPFTPPADTLTPTLTPTDTPTPFPTSSPTPLAPENYLTNFQVISDTPEELQFTLDYHYNGADGGIAFYAGCLENGEERLCSPTDPPRLEGPSSGTLFFTLTYFGDGTETFTTDAIIVFVHRTSDGILVFENSYSYLKTWFVVSETATTVP